MIFIRYYSSFVTNIRLRGVFFFVKAINEPLILRLLFLDDEVFARVGGHETACGGYPDGRIASHWKRGRTGS